MSHSYHDRGELSSSQIAVFLDDPVAWYHVHKIKDWPKIEPTPAMQFGTAVHTMIENGGPDRSKFIEIPREVLNKDGHKKGKAWTEFKASHPSDAMFHNRGERIPLIEIWESLLANRHCKAWIDEPRKEEKIYWTDAETGINCRAMLDVISQYPVPCVVDWKTSTTIDARKFQGEVYQRHYATRLAFYSRGMASIGMERLPIIAVAIENSGSYRVQPFELSQDWIDAADVELSRTLERILNFDIRSEIDKDIVTLSAPRWAKFDSEYEVNE